MFDGICWCIVVTKTVRGWTGSTPLWLALFIAICVAVAIGIFVAVWNLYGNVETLAARGNAHGFEDLWQHYLAKYVTPLEYPAGTGAVVLLAFFILARLLVYVPRIWFFAFGPFVEKRKLPRYVAGILGFAAMAVGALSSVVEFTIGHPVFAVGFVGVGIAGSFLFGAFLATQLRVRISVQNGGSEDVALIARMAALMTELAGSSPSGLDAPVGTDVTDLKTAVVTVPEGNPFVEAAKWVVTTLFTSAPWHVLVGVSSEMVSVSISRNLRSYAAVDIKPDLLDSPTVTDGSQKQDGSALAPYLLEFAAAAVITSIAKEHPGFKGLAGERAADWISVGLQFVATTRFMHDRPTQRRLLARSLDRDPTNLLAEFALRSLDFEDSTESGRSERAEAAYLEWLAAKLYAIRREPRRPLHVRASDRAYGFDPSAPPNTGSTPRDLVAVAAEAKILKCEFTGFGMRHKLKGSGYVDIYRRLLFAYLVISLNARTFELKDGAGSSQVEELNEGKIDLTVAAKWACQSVHNNMPPSGTLRNRMRPNFALFLSDAILADPETKYLKWFTIAMTTSAPSVARNAASVLADRHRVTAEDSKVQKRWLDLLIERVETACIDPSTRTKVRDDPMLRSFPGEDWFEDATGEGTVKLPEGYNQPE
jgi:hypothetical protein